MKKIFNFLRTKQKAILKVGSRIFEADEIDVWGDPVNDTIHITLNNHNERHLNIVVMSTKKWMELQTNKN